MKGSIALFVAVIAFLVVVLVCYAREAQSLIDRGCTERLVGKTPIWDCPDVGGQAPLAQW